MLEDYEFNRDNVASDTKRTRNRRRFERDRYFTTAVDLNDLRQASKISSSTNRDTPKGTMSSPATKITGNKLAQEIHDEFLTCKICLEGFKNPKCLDCLHTFCESCIDNHVTSECTYKKYSDYREFTCPLCRKRTQLPIGGVKKLPDNFLVSSLSEVVSRQKPSKFPFCDICKLVSHKHREANSKCLDCNKLLCKQCVEMHKNTKVTKGHSLFDVEIEKDIECKEHSEEVVRFYCEPCETCICVLCTFNEHKDHEITQFSDAVSKYKESIQRLLDNCKDKITVFDDQLATLAKCDTLIKKAEEKIRDVAIQFISDIRTKEKGLVEQLHTLYGDELMGYITRRNEMQVNLESLKSTCNLTELVLKGKDIELLLLKKQVQEKLSHLSEVKLKDLPATVMKIIFFSPGTLELGQLEDAETTNGLIRTKPIQQLTGQAKNIATTANITQTELKMTDVCIRKQTATIGVQTDAVGEPAQCTQPGQCEPSAPNTSLDTEVTFTIAQNENKAESNATERSRPSLRHLRGYTSLLARTPSVEEGTPTPTIVASPTPTETPQDAAAARRHRRRRQRPERVDVSVRPTTNTVANTGPILSYSSSIEDNNYHDADG